MQRVEVEVLGPLVVRVDGTPVALPGPKQRYLVAALALAQGRAVSVGALIDAVWGEDAPDGADHTLQQHVSAVRKLLGGAGGAGGRLVTRSPGYLLEVEALDSAAFETEATSATARAAAGDAAGAAAGWAAALGRWRGPALADASATPPLEAAAVRLEGMHLAALEGSFDARLSCGLVPAWCRRSRRSWPATPSTSASGPS